MVTTAMVGCAPCSPWLSRRTGRPPPWRPVAGRSGAQRRLRPGRPPLARAHVRAEAEKGARGRPREVVARCDSTRALPDRYRGTQDERDPDHEVRQWRPGPHLEPELLGPVRGAGD